MAPMLWRYEERGKRGTYIFERHNEKLGILDYILPRSNGTLYKTGTVSLLSGIYQFHLFQLVCTRATTVCLMSNGLFFLPPRKISKMFDMKNIATKWMSSGFASFIHFHWRNNESTSYTIPILSSLYSSTRTNNRPTTVQDKASK